MQRYAVDQGNEVAGRLVAITVDVIGQPDRQMIVPVAGDCAVEAAERGIEEGRGSHAEGEPPTLDGDSVGRQHRGEYIDGVSCRVDGCDPSQHQLGRVVEGGLDELGLVEEVMRHEPGGGSEAAGQGPQRQAVDAALGDHLVGRAGQLGPAIGGGGSYDDSDSIVSTTSVVMGLLCVR